MGIAVAVVYLPLYLVFSIIAGVLAKNINKNIEESGVTDKFIIKHKIMGFVIAVIFTWLLILLVPVKGNTDFRALFIQLGLTLTGPIIFVSIANALFSKSVNRKCISLGALLSTIAMPWVTYIAASNYYNVINYPVYLYSCTNAEIVFLKKVKPANNVFLHKDLFTNVSKRRQSETRPIGLFLLNQSNLEYIERLAPQQNDNGKPAYEKISIKGERVLRPENGVETNYVTERVDAVTSDYEVIPIRLDFPNERKNGIGGSRIEVYRRKDNELIAYAQYYWDNKTFRACPDKAHQGLFAYKFIVAALKISSSSPINGL